MAADATSEWLDMQTDRRLDTAHSAATANWWEDGYDPAGKDRATTRVHLRAAVQEAWAKPLPPEIESLLAAADAATARFSGVPEATRAAFITDWNQVWRDKFIRTRYIPPSLTKISLALHDLRGIDLTDADLSRSPERYQQHPGVDLSDSTLVRTHLSGTDLSGSLLVGANLEGAFLVETSLARASLASAVLKHANLRGADLSEADLTGADLRGADLRGARLRHAKLDGADLRQARGLTLDENSVVNTKFTNRSGAVWTAMLAGVRCLRWIDKRLPGRPSLDFDMSVSEDRWSALRRTYSGPKFFVSLLFLIAFALPFIIQVSVLSQIGRAEGPLVSMVERVTGRAVREAQPTTEEVSEQRDLLAAQYEAVRSALEEAANKARGAIDHLEALPKTVSIDDLRASTHEAKEALLLVKRLEHDVAVLRERARNWAATEVAARRYPAWHVLLGIDQRQWSWTVLLILLFVYNGLKWLLTVTIAPMRDAEERSHTTPAKLEYMPVWPLHRVASVLYWLSLGAGVLSLYSLLTTPVYKLW